MDAQTIESGRRTVTHLAEYLEELKTQAKQLEDQAPAQERGYFTPTEDNRIRAILVSYRQSRAALLELIDAFQRDRNDHHQDHPAAFLVAFAAALILVDAARFLRELTESRSVLRRKLNEPALEFDIPAGTYDTVQASLTSARHAWRLYHALAYAEENQALLHQVAAERQLQEVLEIINRLRERLDLSLTQFARARWRTRTDQAIRRLGRSLYSQAIYSLQKLGASLMADTYVKPGHCPQLPSHVASALRTLVRVGDLLVVRKEYAVTNYFLPGHWPHAALHLGNSNDLAQLGIDSLSQENLENFAIPSAHLAKNPNQPCTRQVLESMKDGVLLRPLDSPFSSDSIVVLRPMLTQDELAEGIARALTHTGKPYDFDFNFARSDRLVCTEVAYRAYDGIGAIAFNLTHRAGRLTLSGDDLITMARHQQGLMPVAAYAPRFSPSVTTNISEITKILATAQGNSPREDRPGGGSLLT